MQLIEYITGLLYAFIKLTFFKLLIYVNIEHKSKISLLVVMVSEITV